MKPLKLEIEGVNSFREKQTVDFEALSQGNLFCISGKTGSGKTTILDCVILGLYEKLPSFSSRGKIEDYINLRSDRAEIKLTFELDGKIYRTERVISRKAGGNTVRLTDAETGIAVKEKSKETFDFLGEKLGLDVDQFARVIILQQGEFARFLKATKSDRNKMVINLFRLGRFEEISSRFGDAQRKLKSELDSKDMLLGEYEEDTQENLDACVKKISDAEKSLKLTETEYENALSLRKKAEETEKKLREYESALEKKAALDAFKATLDERELRLKEYESEREKGRLRSKSRYAEKEELIKRSARLENNRMLLSELEKRAVALSEKRSVYKLCKERADADAAAYKKELADAEIIKEKIKAYPFTRADELTAKYKEKVFACNERIKYGRLLTEIRAVITAKTAEAEKCGKELEKSASELRILTENAEAARAALTRAITESGAETLKKGLKAGDVCPVCGEILKKDPTLSVDSGISEAERTVKDCERAALACQKSNSELSARLAGLKAELSSAVLRCSEYEDNLAKTGNVTEEEVNALKKALDAAVEWEKTDKNVTELEARSSKSAAECRLLLQQGLDDKKDYETRKAALEISDVHRLEQEIKVVAENISAIDKEINAFEKLCAEVDDERRNLDRAKSENAAALSMLAPVLNAKPEISVGTAAGYAEKVEYLDKRRLELTAEKAGALRVCETLKTRLEIKRRIKAERAAINKKYERITSLCRLFARGEFNAFVATEYIKDFTCTASVTLGELTGGKYSLSYDEIEGDFYVTDFLSGNEKRKAKTLSGGETFLASLSMAIALSQEIARFGTFDFFFIDEGFGTLHDAALDQVLDVLTKLSMSSLVGLVTHRTELIGRIPMTLIVEEADEYRGTTCRISE